MKLFIVCYFFFVYIQKKLNFFLSELIFSSKKQKSYENLRKELIKFCACTAQTYAITATQSIMQINEPNLNFEFQQEFDLVKSCTRTLSLKSQKKNKIRRKKKRLLWKPRVKIVQPNWRHIHSTQTVSKLLIKNELKCNRKQNIAYRNILKYCRVSRYSILFFSHSHSHSRSLLFLNLNFMFNKKFSIITHCW